MPRHSRLFCTRYSDCMLRTWGLLSSKGARSAVVRGASSFIKFKEGPATCWKLVIHPGAPILCFGCSSIFFGDTAEMHKGYALCVVTGMKINRRCGLWPLVLRAKLHMTFYTEPCPTRSCNATRCHQGLDMAIFLLVPYGCGGTATFDSKHMPVNVWMMYNF